MMNHFMEQSYGELLPHNMFCFSCNSPPPLSPFELQTMVVPNYYLSITLPEHNCENKNTDNLKKLFIMNYNRVTAEDKR